MDPRPSPTDALPSDATSDATSDSAPPDRPRRRRRLAGLALALAGLAAIAGLAIALRRPLIERWLLHRLESPSAEVRAAAARRLAAAGCERAVPRLALLLRQSAASDRALIEALWDIGPPGRAALAREAIAAGGSEGDPRSTGLLTAAFLEFAIERPRRGVELLEAIDAAAAGAASRQRAAADAVRLGREALPAIIALLESRERSTALRRGLARAVAVIEGPGGGPAAEALFAIARAPSEPDDVRGAAWAALDGIGAASARVTLDFTAAAAVPGGAAEILVRAGFDRPLDIFILELDADAAVVEDLRPEIAGTASADIPRASVVHGRSRDGGWLAGVQYYGGTGARFLEPGSGVVLLRIVARLRRDAPGGDAALALRSIQFTGMGPRSLQAAIAAPPRLRVLPGAAPAGRGAADAAPAEEPPALALATTPEGVVVSWDGLAPESAAAAAVDRIVVLRDGGERAQLEPAARSWTDPYATRLMTRYRVEARDASGNAAWTLEGDLNGEAAGPVIEAEHVRAEPGARGIAVRILASHAERAQGVSFSLRVDPALARIVRLTGEGTLPDALEMRNFFYQSHTLESGETAAGVLDIAPPLVFLPPGLRQHVATVEIDLDDAVPAGAEVPIEFGSFGLPPGMNILTVRQAESAAAATLDGAILVGAAALAGVRDAAAAVRTVAIDAAAPEGAAAPVESAAGIALSWTSPLPYDVIEIARDGVRIAEIPGSRARHLDAEAGPGPHRYSVRARIGDRRSFPVIVPWPPAD